MAPLPQRPLRQHYVPRFLLRGFARGGTDRLVVLDKRDSRCFEAGIADVAVEKGFYDLEVEQGTLTLEPGLAGLESQAARAISRIRRERCVRALPVADRAALAVFVLNLFVRGPNRRAVILDLMHQTKRLLELLNAGREPASKQIRDLMTVDEDEAKLIALRMTADTRAFLPAILDKEVLLLETTNQCPFFIGDNPVVLANSMPTDGTRGDLGLAVPGIEIYTPISASLVVALLSKEAVAGIHHGCAAEAAARANRPTAQRGMFVAFRQGLRDGSAVAVPPEHVEGLNAMQVHFAERFLYAGSDTFAGARSLLRDRPNSRAGPRMVASHPALDADRAAKSKVEEPPRPPGACG